MTKRLVLACALGINIWGISSASAGWEDFEPQNAQYMQTSSAASPFALSSQYEDDLALALALSASEQEMNKENDRNLSLGIAQSLVTYFPEEQNLDDILIAYTTMQSELDSMWKEALFQVLNSNTHLANQLTHLSGMPNDRIIASFLDDPETQDLASREAKITALGTHILINALA